MPDRARYRSQADGVARVTVALGLFAVSHLLGIWSCLGAIGWVGVPLPFMQPRDPSSPGVDVLFILSASSYLLCGVTIGRFLYRANRNARALGGERHGIRVSPGWTVGWFFVPILSLFKPYQAVKQIWQVSQPSGSSLLPWWWTAWLLMSLGGNALDKVIKAARTHDEVLRANSLSVGHSLLAIAAAAAVFAVVRGLHRIQQHHQDRGAPLETPGDPAQSWDGAAA